MAYRDARGHSIHHLRQVNFLMFHISQISEELHEERQDDS